MRRIAAALGLLALAACGIKGDPVPPGPDRAPLVLEPGLRAQGTDAVNTTF